MVALSRAWVSEQWRNEVILPPFFVWSEKFWKKKKNDGDWYVNDTKSIKV